jgi:NADPH:quinone reductase-like Zn-dependent oxidoreductase
MKAIYLEQKGGADALVAEEISRPNPGKDDALVKVHATAITPKGFQCFPTLNTRTACAPPSDH